MHGIRADVAAHSAQAARKGVLLSIVEERKAQGQWEDPGTRNLERPVQQQRLHASALDAGVCPNGGSSVVTWTRVCGTAGDALIPISAVEVVSPAEADSQCAASL